MNELPFEPDWVSPPGETIADILHKRELSPSAFAAATGLEARHVNNLLRGRAAITAETADILYSHLGGTRGFWLRRDSDYRRDAERLGLGDAPAGAEWLNGLPVVDMIRFGWIKRKADVAAQVAECLRFFGVTDEKTWHSTLGVPVEMAAFRTSKTFDSSPGSVAAWLQQGEIQARHMRCEPWNKERFRDLLPNLRSLTRRKDARKFLPELMRQCATCGVAVIVLRAPKGCRASGATRFIEPGKALLLLSFRYLSDDHFWFSFFHEAGHLVLHDDTAVFVEGADMLTNRDEADANTFAADVLIPPRFQSELMNLELRYRDVIGFALRIGVSPGVVVGQLQHRGRLQRSQLNRAKRTFRWT